MKLTSESKAFYYEVYQVTLKIPKGKVTSYGHVAYLCGKPGNARQVGSAMKNLEYIVNALNIELPEPEKIQQQVPWWRVVLSSGKISPREDHVGEYRQASMLRTENVEVLNGLLIDLEENGWFPDDL